MGSFDPIDVHFYDITSDDTVNADDLNAWLENAATRNGLNSPYLSGDTNLHWAVDFTDFLQLADNFGRERQDWSDGDFTGDKEVNFNDFLSLSANFGNNANTAAAAAPEPTSVCLAMFGVLGFIGFRKRR